MRASGLEGGKSRAPLLPSASVHRGGAPGVAPPTSPLCFVSVLRVLTLSSCGDSLPFLVPLSLPVMTALLVFLVPSVVAVSPILSSLAWALFLPHHTVSLLKGDRAGVAMRCGGAKNLPGSRLLTPLEATGLSWTRAGAPLTPFIHLTVHLWDALQELFAALVILRAGVVTLSLQVEETGRTPGAGVAVHADVAVRRAVRHTLALCKAWHSTLGAGLLALALVQVEAGPASSAEVTGEAGVTLRSALSAVVSVWGACSIVTAGTGGQTHASLFHAVPLQEDEEPRLAGQAAIVLRTRQAPALTPRDALFLLPVPGGVLLTISVLHTAQDQNKGDQL